MFNKRQPNIRRFKNDNEFIYPISSSNFFAWLNPDADGLAHFLKEKGVLAYSNHRNPNDPNSIMIYCQFVDEDTLKPFADWFEESTLTLGNEQPERKIENLEFWIGDDLEGYCRTLT